MPTFNTYDQSAGGFAQLIEMFQIVTAGRATLVTASPDEIRLQLDGIRYAVSGTGLTIEVIGGPPFITGGQITGLRAVNPTLGDSMELTEVAISVPDMVASVGRDGEITSVLDYLAFEIGPYFYFGSDLQDDGLIMAQRGGLDGDDFFALEGGDDRMNGGGGNDILLGGAGNDSLAGGDGGDSLDGREGRDSLEGGAGRDSIFGGFGTDTLYGGTGADLVSGSDFFTPEFSQDLLYGGAGNDTLSNYEASNSTFFGGSGNDSLEGSRRGQDTLFGDAGNDTLFASFQSWLYGGEGDDRLENAASKYAVLSGDGGRDTLSGEGFEDRLFGGADADRLFGGDAADRMDGGSGADAMTGGTGNDIYVVGSRLDRVIEQADGGVDMVLAKVSHRMQGHVEKLLLTRFGDTTGVGNGLNNLISGNDGDNTLIGRGGQDTLRGSGGADRFVFDQTPGAQDADVITDFAAGEDVIALKAAAFGLPRGALVADRFHLGSAATEADHRILYDAATGHLWFDADGSGAGAALRFATLQNRAVIGADDILIA